MFALVVLLLTLVPYFAAAGHSDAAWQFSGNLIGVEDANSYLGKMRMGASGELNFSLFYTAERGSKGVLLLLPYLVAGWLVGGVVPQSSPAHTAALIVGYHLLRALAGGLMLWTTYRFIACFLDTERQRLVAFVFAIVGGGFGWLVALTSAASGQGDWLGSPPPEFFIPEGFSFLTLLSLPHLTLARAALLGGFVLLFRALPDGNGQDARLWALFQPRQRGELRSVLLACACWIGVGLVVPFSLASIYAVLGTWGLAAWVRRRAFPVELVAPFVISAGLTLPLFTFLAYQFSANPLLGQWAAQNLLPSPHPLHYFMAYVVIGVPALWGARWAWKRAGWANIRYMLLFAWVLAAPVLVYLPLNVQRRLSEGVIVPLAVLAAAGLDSRRPRLAFVWAGVASLSVVFLLLGAWSTANNVSSPVFHPTALVRAFDWLNTHAGELCSAPEPEGYIPVLLAAHTTGNALPVYARLRVVIGHGPETLGGQQKVEQVRRFYAGEMTMAQMRVFLAGESFRSDVPADAVCAILYTPRERELAGGDAAPAWLSLAEPIYQEGEYAIYRVLE